MKKKLLGLAIVLAMVAAFIVPMTVSAATLTVGSGQTYTNIQSAITAAAPGDTIDVLAGTYSVSGISVPKGVTLDGPNIGINANTGSRGAEAIIQFTSGSQGFGVSTTSPVIIDGFTIEGPGMMLYTGPSGTNVTFQNDIVTDVATGEGFFYNAPATLGFKNNKVTDATINGNNSDILFVAGNWNGSTGTVVTITGNVFDDSAVTVANQCDALNLSSCSGTISGNTFENLAYYGVLLANDCGETVSNNIFNNILQGDTFDSHGAGVRFYTPTGAGPVTITGNTFENSYIGLAVRDGDSIASMNVTINNNNFGPNNHFNIFSGSSDAVDAAYNNWGSGATAASIFASFGGTGAPLIVYQPFNNATTTPLAPPPANKTVNVTGNVTAATVALTYTNSPVISFGMFNEGRNPATGWTSTGADYGNVTITPGSDASPSWTVNAFSDNSNGNFANGKMYCDALSRYLDQAMYVNFSLDGSTWGTSGQLNAGTSIGGTDLTQNFVLGAAQNVSHADVVAGQGNYYIYVQLTAGVTP